MRGEQVMKKQIIILPLLVLALSGCKSAPSFMTPYEEFNFALSWGINAQSSYDSKTKVLVKTTSVRTRSKDEYVTSYQFPNLLDVYNSVKDINPYSYSDTYDPFDGNPHMYTTPYEKYELTIGDKTISIDQWPIGFDINKENNGLTAKGKKLMTLLCSIKDTIQNSEEWKALPDYEVLYK